MKKQKLGIIILICLFLFPNYVKAETVKENLESVLKKEEIPYDLSDYYEDDKQVTIYLFYGDGCGYCKKLLTYLNSILPEYGKYFKLEAYEVWENNDNSDLMSEVATFMKKEANGVPFYVIGNQAFVGYGESYNENIKTAITNLYNASDRYDVFDEMERAKKEEEKKDTAPSTLPIILCNAAITGIAVVSIIVFENYKFRTLNGKIEEIIKKVEKDTKTIKTTKKEKGKK